MSTFRTGYFDLALDDLGAVIATAQKALADVEFDTIVGTGFSGSVVIPALALAMGKSFVLIRKETDTDCHHRPGALLGNLGARWIFVDDFVSSGRTRQRVGEKLHAAAAGQNNPIETTWVGQYMYAWDSGQYNPFHPCWILEDTEALT